MSRGTASGPLDGIFVLDLTRVLAGPYCTLVLADLGARVLKIERPVTGDDARGIGPFVAGQSAYFQSVNRGKESLALDLHEPGDRALFERLLARADVLVENFRPGAMERLGYGWSDLHARFPRLVYAAVSGFGQSGPLAKRPAYDLVVQAMGGLMSITGQPGAPPTRVGSSIGDLAAGLFGAVGIASALRHRDRTGAAIFVDVAMLDCQVALLENAIARYEATGEVPGPMGSRHPSITPFEAYPTADGWIVLAAGNDALFARLVATLDLPALAGDPRFATNDLRCRNAGALHDALAARLREQPTSFWMERLDAAGLPGGPLQNVAQVLAHPQVRARNMVVRVDDPRLPAPFSVAGNPIKSPSFPDPPTRPPAPALDADRARVLAWLDGPEPRA
jgi:CoA:oxalate CoA-transferase